MRTLKILGFLLTYPSEMHRGVVDEFRSILRQENLLSEGVMEALEKMMDSFEQDDLLDLQEEYVDLFDRSPSLSLHLFEHIHGDSRERGQALVDLAQVYEKSGLLIAADENPDYLPLFLEYAATLPVAETKENLSSIVNITMAIAERLKNRQSSYACIFEALADVASRKANPDAVQEALKKSSGASYDLEQIDKEWEEQFAFDNALPAGGQSDGCPRAAEMLARMNVPTTKEEVRE